MIRALRTGRPRVGTLPPFLAMVIVLLVTVGCSHSTTRVTQTGASPSGNYNAVNAPSGGGNNGGGAAQPGYQPSPSRSYKTVSASSGGGDNDGGAAQPGYQPSPSGSYNTLSAGSGGGPAGPSIPVYIGVSGNGSGRTKSFRTHSSALFVAYAYQCSTKGSESFATVIVRSDPPKTKSGTEGNRQRIVKTSGSQGDSSVKIHVHSGVSYYLRISTNCDWTIAVGPLK